MSGKLLGITRMALKLALIELLVPGGTLVVLALILSGSPVPTGPEKAIRLRRLGQRIVLTAAGIISGHVRPGWRPQREGG